MSTGGCNLFCFSLKLEVRMLGGGFLRKKEAKDKEHSFLGEVV